MKRHFNICLIISLSIGLWACGNSPKQEAIAEEFEVGSIMDMPLQTEAGVSLKLADLNGKMVLVNFWATWCRPCIKEMPSLDKAREILEAEGFVFLAVSDESWEKIDGFRAKNPYGFQWIRLEEPVNGFEIYSLPTTIILNEKGEEVYRHVGIEEWDSPEILEKLRKLKP